MIKDIPKDDSAFKKDEEKVHKTLPTVIVMTIQRVQNQLLWTQYANHKALLKMKKCANINESELFHGT